MRERSESRVEYICRLGASLAATCLESEKTRTLRPRRGAKRVALLAFGGWICICFATNAWNGWSPLVWWSCTVALPKRATLPQQPHGMNWPRASRLWSTSPSSSAGVCGYARELRAEQRSVVRILEARRGTDHLQ